MIGLVASFFAGTLLERKPDFCQYERLGESNFATGTYFHDKYYCVWTQGRDADKIVTTECHEQLHTILHQDNKSYQHFCKC